MREACAKWTPACESTRGVFSKALTISQRIRECATTPCETEKLKDLSADYTVIVRRFFDLPKADTRPIWLFSLINDSEPPLVEQVDASVDAKLRGLAARIEGLQNQTQALEDAVAKGGVMQEAKAAESVDSLGTEGHAVFTDFQPLSGLIDHSFTLGDDKKKAGPLREKRIAANKIAIELGKLRDRLILLQRRTRKEPSPRLDLSRVYNPSVEDDAGKEVEAPGRTIGKINLARFNNPFAKRTDSMSATGIINAAAREHTRINHPLINAEPKKTLLDIPGSVPPLFGKKGDTISPPSIEEKGPDGAFDAFLRLSGFKGERKKIDAMRRKGLTQTVGDPARYAGLVHEQENDTCALVTQQQVLEAHGFIKKGDPKANELRLREEAIRKAYFRGGTAFQYAGSMLVDHGLIVTKHDKVGLEEFDKAVLNGKMAIASVDARWLWGMESSQRAMGHSILVTGVEVSKKTGKVLGYYYNDSGDDPPKGAGFVPVGKFRKAYKIRGGRFTEVQ
ncbi:MAG: hypothetical protein ABIJ96_06450 [Elusimicrobiota bacterium]